MIIIKKFNKKKKKPYAGWEERLEKEKNTCGSSLCIHNIMPKKMEKEEEEEEKK